MSYSNLIFNKTDSQQENIQFSQQQTPPERGGVRVRYNNTYLDTLTGPVPTVSISHSMSNDSNDLPEYIRTSIQIEGKIVRNNSWDTYPPQSGFKAVTAAISGLTSLFTGQSYNTIIGGQSTSVNGSTFGTIAITCSSGTGGAIDVLYEASGCFIKDINFQPTNDNWTKTADYTISLESIQAFPVIDGYAQYNDFPVTNKVDRWSIEQLDDTFSTNSFVGLDGRMLPEYSNPQLGITQANQIPGTTVGGTPTGATALGIKSIPQYRVTHTVSAKGLPRPISPPSSGTNGLSSMTLTTQNCINNARKWVEKQLDLSARHPSEAAEPTGIMPYIVLPNNYFYNHIRSVNTDLSTYEVTDSWLALPLSIPYLDSYTIESSIDENMIKTVRVVGNIVGLHPLDNTGKSIETVSDLKTNSPIIPVSGYSGDAVTTSYNVLDDGAAGAGYSTRIDPNTGNTIVTPLASARAGSIGVLSNKYDHAVKGWLYDIKPYLYRRACAVINSPDRIIDYINSTNITNAPANHIYARDRLLSPTPYSMTEGHDPKKGTISYSVEYRNNLKLISGVISENIDISYDVPRDEVATIAVPGRALGPILSRTGRSASRKTININVVVLPPQNISEAYLNQATCPLYTGGYIYTTIKNIIQANKPGGISYVQNDSESWSPSQGRYSRSVQWIYQGCSISTNYITGN